MSRPTLSALDSSLYPQVWQQQTFTNSYDLLMALLTNDITLDAADFSKHLLTNDTYQEWITATVFGRYIQRQFAAFYHQSEDSFNIGIPTLFRNELCRYGRYLPLEQRLFVAGEMPKDARHDKLFTTCLNPATVWTEAKRLTQTEEGLVSVNNQQPIINHPAINQANINQPNINQPNINQPNINQPNINQPNINQPNINQPNINHVIVNQLQVKSKQVLCFPIRHNKRTSDRLRNEVLILDFQELRLVHETKITTKKRSNIEGTILLRTYELR